jgi:hypothetical protein
MVETILIAGQMDTFGSDDLKQLSSTISSINIGPIVYSIENRRKVGGDSAEGVKPHYHKPETQKEAVIDVDKFLLLSHHVSKAKIAGIGENRLETYHVGTNGLRPREL